MPNLSPLWSCLANIEAPADDFEAAKAAATAASDDECRAAIEGMRATATAEMIKTLDEMPIDGMARA